MAEGSYAGQELNDAAEIWWVPLVMGIVAILFGLLWLSQPGETAKWVTFIVGFWWLASGVINLVSLFVDRTMWGWKLFSGVLGLAAGWVVLDAAAQTPLLAAVGLGAIYVIVVGIQGMIIGVIDIIKAFKGGGWGIGIIGVLSLIFGLLLVFNPLLGAVALPLFFGITSVVLGAVAVFVAFQARKAMQAAVAA